MHLVEFEQGTFWFCLIRVHPNQPIMRDSVVPKFSKPIRMLDFLTRNFSRKALSLIFCTAEKCLVTGGVLCRYPLKSSLWFFVIQNIIFVSICRHEWQKYYIQHTIFKVLDRYQIRKKSANCKSSSFIWRSTNVMKASTDSSSIYVIIDVSHVCYLKV